MTKKILRDYEQKSQIRITLYPHLEEARLIDDFFLQNRKWKKGEFFLEAALEKIEREKELKEFQEKLRRSHGNTN